MSHSSHYPPSLRDDVTISRFSLSSSPHHPSHPYRVPDRFPSFRKPLLPDPISSDIDSHRAYLERSNSCQRTHYSTLLRDNVTFSPFSLPSSPHYHSHPYLVPDRFPSFRKPLLPDPISSDIDRHRAYSERSNLSQLTQYSHSYKPNQHKQLSEHNVPQSDVLPYSSNKNEPIHIHYRTPPSVLHSITNTLSQVHLYSIHTASDNTSGTSPRSTPELILVEALRTETTSITLVIEVQHLPPPSSALFCAIRHLCQIIFSPANKIMTWGNVLQKLHVFEHLNLFNVTQITDVVNIQEFFANQWNLHHPHTVECTAVHQQQPDDAEQNDVLICLVNTDDLEDDYDSDQPINDHNTCICPSRVRPYKGRNALWTLPRAVQFVFNRDVNPSFTHDHKLTRERLLSLASNYLSSSSNLFFHCENLRKLNAQLHTSPKKQKLTMDHATKLPSFLVIADSHGKFMRPSLTTDQCQIVTKAISGLSWANHHNLHLCATSLLTSPPFSSLISSSTSLLLAIGTNSVRNTCASLILNQIEVLIERLRTSHAHLRRTQSISIMSAFPCAKVSAKFPSVDLLMGNIVSYNEQLRHMAARLNFCFVPSQINENHLGAHRMHLHASHRQLLAHLITNYLHDLVRADVVRPAAKHRSVDAIARRNKKRHDIQKQRRVFHTLSRPMHPIWKLKDVKAFLKHQQITDFTIPDIVQHRVRVQFHREVDQQRAESILPADIFDEKNFFSYHPSHCV
jgi:hypothetical protein